jgi:hypothetical protein
VKVPVAKLLFLLFWEGIHISQPAQTIKLYAIRQGALEPNAAGPP